MHKIIIDEIGEVSFLKSKRAKNICISVRPLYGVKVTVPFFVSYFEAEKVVAHKRNWIVSHLEKTKEIEKKYTRFNGDEIYHTRFHQLVLKKNVTGKISVRIQNRIINVSYPSLVNVESANVQSAVRKGIERALKIEAKNYLPGRVNQLAIKFGLTYNSVSVKNVKSRWGSCSRKKNINLNVHLMRLPDRLIDYVILHELAHTVELNHSSKFWTLLDSIIGGAKQFDKELKNYRVTIF